MKPTRTRLVSFKTLSNTVTSVHSFYTFSSPIVLFTVITTNTATTTTATYTIYRILLLSTVLFTIPNRSLDSYRVYFCALNIALTLCVLS